ncbi:hypothetical protein ES675_06905 [Bizionia algoritergicola]|uniref:Uncharacterized protein n=1 Tax=Bizionia algoritergicola TaxID=291187 RepID=A0A5D0QYJ5_9FLAO|nr:hypothetical protein [Bizionia sp. M204]OBX23431.1 hypothetical protein BAA08_04875 [Bizionia sp. APA-3]TYB73786.1 hypothetical protein ES675_06905 [Bizionia algoritergicola]UPS93052.1 hypothetical protein GMA17_05710 [Bizionia sp. M204]
MNYIKHLNAVFQQFSKDNRLNPTHVSLYMAFFQLWNHNRFPEQFHVNREEVMNLSKIGSKSTYHRCVKELNHYKYLIYHPSHNPFKGSKINMLIFGTTSGQAVDLTVPNQGQALVPLYKHNKQIENNKKLYKLAQPKNQKIVIDFFKTQKWPTIEAQKFFNYYQGIGWKVGGKTKIVNWQATAHNWMLKAEEIKNNKQLSQNKDNPHSREGGNLHTTKNKNYNQPL